MRQWIRERRVGSAAGVGRSTGARRGRVATRYALSGLGCALFVALVFGVQTAAFTLLAL